MARAIGGFRAPALACWTGRRRKAGWSLGAHRLRPISAGLATGAVGFGLGWAAIGGLLSLLARPFWRRAA